MFEPLIKEMQAAGLSPNDAEEGAKKNHRCIGETRCEIN